MGIRFITDEAEIPGLPVTHNAGAKITYCQFLAASRQERYATVMKPEKLLCQNAWPVFGFRELEQEADTQRHALLLGKGPYAVPYFMAKMPGQDAMTILGNPHNMVLAVPNGV